MTYVKLPCSLSFGRKNHILMKISNSSKFVLKVVLTLRKYHIEMKEKLTIRKVIRLSKQNDRIFSKIRNENMVKIPCWGVQRNIRGQIPKTPLTRVFTSYHASYKFHEMMGYGVLGLSLERPNVILEHYFRKLNNNSLLHSCFNDRFV